MDSRLKSLERKQQERERLHRPGGKESRELLQERLQAIYERLKGEPVVFSEMSLAEKQAFLQFEPERFTPEQRSQAVAQIKEHLDSIIEREEEKKP